MKLVVGLGNPGESYAATRHNIGFMVVDALARRENAPPFKKRFKGSVAELALPSQRVLLLKPQTYMNLSGESVQEAAAFYKIPAEDLLAIHDDLDLDFGRMKVLCGGGDGGHRGVRSMIANLPDPGFVRVRMGVGRPRFGEDPAEYVLRNFYPDQTPLLAEWVDLGLKAVLTWLDKGFSIAANRFNKAHLTPEPKPE